MWELVWASSAVDDIVRLKQFLAENNPKAAHQAAKTISEAVQRLKRYPLIGKPVQNMEDYRDLFIRFGAAGYVLRYKIVGETVYILHVRHYREFDFHHI